MNSLFVIYYLGASRLPFIIFYPKECLWKQIVVWLSFCDMTTLKDRCLL